TSSITGRQSSLSISSRSTPLDGPPSTPSGRPAGSTASSPNSLANKLSKLRRTLSLAQLRREHDIPCHPQCSSSLVPLESTLVSACFACDCTRGLFLAEL